MKFRTEIPVHPSDQSLKHDHPILSVGSCFAEHIVNKLSAYKFSVVNNPFGITYNPLSIAHQLNVIRKSQKYDVVDLEKFNHHWLSFDHHGSFSTSSSKETLERIENELAAADKHLGKYRTTILSLGTAWAWFRNDKVVNNCHKLPDSEFDFRMLSIEEMTEQLGEALAKWQRDNPDNRVIVTVSPVRHLRSGFEDNNRSKARLIEVAHSLAETIPNTEYYPSYELLIDDLRDYRFYDKTLTHPSEEAIEYVWEHFKATYFSNPTIDTLEKFESFRAALFHRPRQTSGPAFDGHLQALEKKFEAWVQRWPKANWSVEMKRWNELMKMR